MAAMDWFYSMLIASNCSADHASWATAVVAILLTVTMVKAIFSALFPKR